MSDSAVLRNAATIWAVLEACSMELAAVEQRERIERAKAVFLELAAAAGFTEDQLRECAAQMAEEITA